jgi:RNA polymerase sigma factor (sigma-70 family)
LINFERDFFNQKNSGLVASQAAKQSTEARQRDIFESHRHRAFSLAFYMTGNEMEAEEILTRTFVKAFQESEQPDAFTVDSALVAEMRELFSLQSEQPAAVASPELTLQYRNVLRSDLEAAVQSLPANERLCFLLRDVEGYSPEAIAALLQVPVAQVQRGLFSARLRLRQELAGADRPESEAA